jgi:hypothetical protein
MGLPVEFGGLTDEMIEPVSLNADTGVGRAVHVTPHL